MTSAPGERTQASGMLWDGVLNATPDDTNDGPNPIEALMAALGACVVRNLASTAESAHLVIDRVRILVAADHSDDPPAVTDVRLDIDVRSGAPVSRRRARTALRDDRADDRPGRKPPDPPDRQRCSRRGVA